jgi:predicted DNA-binding protein (MmcQ/YjbR family)
MVSVDHFIKLALSFESAEQHAHFDKSSFRVNKKIFATLDVKSQKVVVKLSDIEQSVFSAYDQSIIYPVKGTWGKQGWTEVELKKVRKNVLNDVLKTSYQNVAPNKSRIKKTCDKDHVFYKSSACPVCPICEKNKKPLEGFLSQLAAPARRALENAGIKTITQLRKKTEEELLSLHGMGPGSIPRLRAILKTSTPETSKSNVLKKDIQSSNSKAVNDFIRQLLPSEKEIIQSLRNVILQTDKQIREHIKWNSLSFYYTGEMQSFNPKEYKRDLVVTNLRQKDHILLIFPTGAKINDTTGLLEGDYQDGRRMVKIYDLKDLKAKTKGLQKVIKKWLSLINK